MRSQNKSIFLESLPVLLYCKKIVFFTVKMNMIGYLNILLVKHNYIKNVVLAFHKKGMFSKPHKSLFGCHASFDFLAWGHILVEVGSLGIGHGLDIE